MAVCIHTAGHAGDHSHDSLVNELFNVALCRARGFARFDDFT